MKYILSILALLCLTVPSMAQEVLPFPVTIGGQSAAVTEKSSIISFLEGPVSSDAVIAVKDVKGQIIVNIFPSDSQGEVENGVQPMIHLFQANESKSISANMAGKTPEPGWYAANIVGGGATSRVCFEVK